MSKQGTVVQVEIINKTNKQFQRSNAILQNVKITDEAPENLPAKGNLAYTIKFAKKSKGLFQHTFNYKEVQVLLTIVVDEENKKNPSKSIKGSKTIKVKITETPATDAEPQNIKWYISERKKKNGND